MSSSPKYSILPILMEALQQDHSRQRNGVHVTDLSMCHKQAGFKRLSPKRHTNRDLNNFSSGKAIHSALQSLIAKHGNQFEIEKRVRHGNVFGSIDIYDVRNNVAIEAKSARISEIKEPNHHHVTQLKSYMAMVGANTGLLIYQLLHHQGESPFAEFEIKMTADERYAILDKLSKDGLNFEINLVKKDLAAMPDVVNDENLKWQCSHCKWKDECDSVRRPTSAN